MHREYRDAAKRWSWCCAVLGLICHARPSYGVKQLCSHDDRLHTKRIKYATASCDGQSASSCWTVVSFDVPEELSRPHAQLSSRAVTPDELGTAVEQTRVSLNVVHSQPLTEDHEDHEDEDEHAGLHYSLDTRIIELGGRPSVLQVQVLYSDADQGNSNPTPGWSGTANSRHVHKGGRSIKLEVMVCTGNETQDTDHKERQDSTLQPPPPSLYPGFFPPLPHFGDHFGGQFGGQFRDRDSLFHSHAAQRHSRWMHVRPESAAMAMGRARNLAGKFEETSGVEQFQDAAIATTSKTSLLRGGNRVESRQSFQRPPPSAGAEAAAFDVIDEVGSCDPFDGGAEWCEEAVSSAELRALEEQGTAMYCSRECQLRGALWCHVFGKKNCRMCSGDCDSFCAGRDNCHCHACPDPGVKETWDCRVGDHMACYDQIGQEDFHALESREQRMTCAPTCLDDGGLWCNAMGIAGCRLCSVSCEDHCASIGEPSGCDCVECPDGLKLPSVPSTLLGERAPVAGEPICTDAADGDAFCVDQVPEKAQQAMAAKGISVECNTQCLPGESWPVWCLAEQTLGCRYCMASCDTSCGEGVLECDTCYTCGGNTVQ